MTERTEIDLAIIEAIKARREIYRAKQAKSDPLGADCYTAHDMYRHTVDAFEYLLQDIGENPEWEGPR